MSPVKKRLEFLVHLGALQLCVLVVSRPAAPEEVPEPAQNIAPAARITASGYLNDSYRPRFAVDGKIPPPGSRRDANEAWCLPQSKAKDASLRFEWDDPVRVAAVVYYGRTAWLWNENFLKVEVFADEEAKPLLAAELKPGHGPQSLVLDTPVEVFEFTLKFPVADKGPNPGASEVQIYSAPPNADLLGKFTKPQLVAQASAPPSTVPQSLELAQKVAAGELGFRQMLVIQRHAIQPSHVYTYHNEGFRAGGGLFLFTPDGEGSGELKTLLDTPQGQVLDCELSYDAKEMLFSWRKSAEDKYHVYRMGIDGKNLTQLTNDDSYNFNACWLPDGGIAFLSTRKSAYAYCWMSPVGIVYRMDRDGGNVRRLSSNYLNDFTPAVLNDGRIIYGRWEYVDRPAIPIQGLWTMNPDGAGMRVFYGNRVLSPATFIEPRAIPGSEKVLCILTAHNGPCRGAIGIIDRRHGVNAQAAIRNLTPEINIGRVDRGSGNHIRGPYESPCPIDGTYYVCSKAGTILARDYATTVEAVLLRPQGGLGFYNAKPLRARPAPGTIPSALPDDTSQDRMATLYLQDVYRGLSPHVKRGQIKEIRVVQEIEKPVSINVSKRAFGFQFPVVSCGATYAPKKVWGTVPVLDDGSASFRVPAGVPIYFMALDEHGRALQRMRSFTHLMPGETQGCIGCHEHRLDTAGMNTRPKAALQAPRELTPPEWGPGGFSYAHVVQPVLDKHCVKCHNAHEHPKGVDLSGDKTDFFNVSYEVLARDGAPGRNPYTKWIPTYNGMEANILEITPGAWGAPASKLADLVLAGHPDENGKKRVQLTGTDERRIYGWIDLNVPYYGTSDSNHRDRRGCRQMWPSDLDRALNEVAARRCISCHEADTEGKVQLPRTRYVRVTNPQLNSFLLAPLAKAAGGTETCGRPAFKTPDDPDYQTILKTFEPIRELLSLRPRIDMEGSP